MNERSAAASLPTRTLLEALIPAEGTVDAAQLYLVGNHLGMTDQQIRLGIRRAVASGDIDHEGRGRGARLRATAALQTALDADAEFLAYAYAQDAGAAPWDGHWHVVSFAIAEADRSARDAMRAGIIRLGGAAIQGAMYVSPNGWEPHVARLAHALGTKAGITTLTTSDLRTAGIAEPRKIAARLWPLDALAANYRGFLTTLDGLLGQAAPGSLDTIERTALAVRLSHAFTVAMEPDPLLPPELLPRGGVGRRARREFARAWARLDAVSGDAPRLFARYGNALSTAASTA